jgi:hypothetical protein
MLSLFPLRLFFLSFSVSDNGFGESRVIATVARLRNGAKKIFRGWMKEKGFSERWTEIKLAKSIYNEKELSRINVCVHPLGCSNPDFESENLIVKAIKTQAAADFEQMRAGKIARQVFYTYEHT